MTTFNPYRNWAPRPPRPRGSSQAFVAGHLSRPFRNERVNSLLSLGILRQHVTDEDHRTLAGVVSHNLGELDCVRLLGELTTPQGVVPVGEVGTIVHRYPRGEAFEVEFDTPFDLVATLRPEEVEGLDG